MVCTQLRTQLYMMVGKQLFALVEFAGIILPPSFYRDRPYNDRPLVPLLARCGRYPPGFGKSLVNQIKTFLHF
jgi:hypothetical protein